jgi:hypothetical protein
MARSPSALMATASSGVKIPRCTASRSSSSFPMPGSIRVDDDIEDVVAGVETNRGPSQGRLEVDVVPKKHARGIVPKVADGMRHAKRHQPPATLGVPWHLFNPLAASRQPCETCGARVHQLASLGARHGGNHNVARGFFEKPTRRR